MKYALISTVAQIALGWGQNKPTKVMQTDEDHQLNRRQRPANRDRSPSRDDVLLHRIQEQKTAIEARKCSYPKCLGLGLLINGVCPGQGYEREDERAPDIEYLHCEKCGLLLCAADGQTCDVCGSFQCAFHCCEENFIDGVFVEDAACDRCPDAAAGHSYVCSPCFLANPRLWCENVSCGAGALPEVVQRSLVIYPERSVCCAAVELVREGEPPMLIRVLRSREQQKATLVSRDVHHAREARQVMRDPNCVERACVKGRQAVADLLLEGYTIAKCSCVSSDATDALGMTERQPYEGLTRGSKELMHGERTEGFHDNRCSGYSPFGYFDDLN